MAEFPVNWLDNIVNEVLELHNLFWVTHFLAETWVIFALFIPNGFFGPSVNHLEPLKEENSQVFWLVIRATMDGWNHSHNDLAKDIQEIDLWHSELNQHLDKLDGI